MNEVDLYKKQCSVKKYLADPNVLDALGNALISGELDLSGYPVSLSCWELLSDILSKSKVIKKLNLCDCMTPTLGFDYIFNALMNNDKITEVILYGNNIDSDSTIKLGKLLAVNKSVKVLNLSWNNIGGQLEAFATFCDGLSKNESLEYLDLRNNQICSAGASNLSSAIQLNHTLKFLDLRWNRLKNKGVECLQNALQSNKSLQELLLKGNFVHIQQISNIELCVKKNEELDNLKRDYDLQIAFLLKELKRSKDKRVQQITKITQISQQRFVEMERKFEEISKILIKKEEHVRTQQLQIRKVEKELSKRKEKISEIKEELDCVKRKKNWLEKALEEKENDYSRTVNEIVDKLKFEREQNYKLLKEISDKNTALEILKDDILKINSKWESCIKDKTEQVEHNWKIKLADTENKFSKQLAEVRGKLIEKELLFLKEEEQKLKKFRIRAEEAEEIKFSMEAEIASLQEKTADQQSKIKELQKELILISTELTTSQQDLKNEKTEIKKSKEALEKINVDLIWANKTIEKLEHGVLEEQRKVRDGDLKLKEVNLRILQLKEEEKLRSELLASALKSYLRSLGDSCFTV